MPLATTKVKDVMTTDPAIITQDENIHIALDMLTRTPSGKLVVVDSNDRQRVLGTIGFADVAEAYNREVRKNSMKTPWHRKPIPGPLLAFHIRRGGQGKPHGSWPVPCKWNPLSLNRSKIRW